MAAQGVQRLSPRQREILTLVAQGYANHEIARRLCLSRSTVNGYLTDAYRALGVRNRTGAVVALWRAAQGGG